MTPHVFTIDAAHSFADTLVDGVIRRYGKDQGVFTRTTILLPNRRAVRAVQDAFLRASEGRASLLPRLRPLGDVDEDELSFDASLTDQLDTDIEAAIDPLARQLILARLIARWHRRTGREPALIPAEAARMASSLARLIDQVETEGLDWNNLTDLVPERFSRHWQETLDFLTIVTTNWPDILKDFGRIDPAARRNRLLNAQADLWRDAPPSYPVIAAGSTGSLPATRNLMKIIARLPQGAIIMPGLDRGLSDEDWQALQPSHPQYGLKDLLEGVGVHRLEVEDWVEHAADPIISSRLQGIRRALNPSAWGKGQVQSAPLSGISHLEAPGEREEAAAIALILREALETPGQTAALVSADQVLSRRVAAQLRRWSIEVDISAGTPLSRTPTGRFLALTAVAVGQRLSPAPLLALLKHPFTACGQDKGAFRRMVRRLETQVLRGVRPAPGTEGLLAACEDADLRDWLTKVLAAIAPFEAALSKGDTPLEELVKTHIACAEALAASEERALWSASDGEAAADFIADLLAAAPLLDNVSGEAYPALFSTLMADRTVRSPIGRHPRLSIWGTIEARLQRADIMVLGGLNEGSWPSPPSPDPWMSEPMRVAFGLPSAARRIGLAAHDFIQGLGAKRVVLSRALKSDGAPTVAARWLTALKTLYGDGIERADTYLSWAHALDQASAIPISMPRPCPPLHARPKQASVTQVERWMRDPYALYAREILKLRPLDPLDQDPDAAERGTMIHGILDQYATLTKNGDAPIGIETLLRLGEETFAPFDDRPAVRGFWWPRFERIAHWFIEEQAKRTKEGHKILATEISAKWRVEDAPPFTLTAKADRIDRLRDGNIEIIDYKTGTAPSNKRVEAGFAPQLPLEGLLIQEGAFDGIKRADVGALTYWRLSGGVTAIDIKPVKDHEARIAQARGGLVGLIKAFNRETTPYLPSPRGDEPGYGDYDHLARVSEWRAPQDGGEDG